MVMLVRVMVRVRFKVLVRVLVRFTVMVKGSGWVKVRVRVMIKKICNG